jgi:hypothetical protein
MTFFKLAAIAAALATLPAAASRAGDPPPPPCITNCPTPTTPPGSVSPH